MTALGPLAPLSRLSSYSVPTKLVQLCLLCLAAAHYAPLVLSVEASTISPQDCIDPNNREITHRVRRGELTTICLYVGPGGDWNSDINYKRFSVNLVADEFSSYHIPGSYQGIVNTPPNRPLFDSNVTHIFAMSQSSLSFLRRFHDKTSNQVFPYLTAIIDVRDGIVRGIAWDDACIFCEKATCLANTYNFDGSVATTEQISQPVNGCYLTEMQCAGFAVDGSNTCDLRLFVVWTGTDVNGNVLLSSDSRFSMFPPNRIQENVRGQYDSMVESLENMRDKIPGMGSRNESSGQ